MTDRRLIEEEIPIVAINAASMREKALRHGHISTMHVWWARRPLSMSRAIVFATLMPDPGEGDRREINNRLTYAAEFEASSEPSRMDPLRQLLRGAYPDQPPRVLDCFAGGGAIPLEALRLGCDVTALDLNPVASLVERCVLEYPESLGQGRDATSSLADDFVEWSSWVGDRVTEELKKLFPHNGEGIPSTYFWCRTMPCNNPGCRTIVPLLSSLWLANSKRRKAWIGLAASEAEMAIKVFVGTSPPKDLDEGTVKASSVTCPACGSAMHAKDVRKYAKTVGFGSRLYAVLELRDGKRIYRAPRDEELKAATSRSAAALEGLEGIEAEDGVPLLPDEPVDDIGYINLQNLVYGYNTWRSLFSPRQLVVLAHLSIAVHEAYAQMLARGIDEPYARALCTYLGLMVDRIADYNSSFCGWHVTGEYIRNTFPRQAISMVWDFTEIDPFGPGSGNWKGATKWVELAIRHCAAASRVPARVMRGNAQKLPFEDSSFDAVVTDPPYYFSVMYSDLSDFFYVWLKRSIGFLHPELFATQWTPKAEEVIQNRTNPKSPRYISAQDFEQRLARSLEEIARVVKPEGIVTLVFAHTDVVAWEKLLRALRSAGLVVTTSWPMRSEMPNRPLALVKAALGSSVILVCRRPSLSTLRTLTTSFVSSKSRSRGASRSSIA